MLEVFPLFEGTLKSLAVLREVWLFIQELCFLDLKNLFESMRATFETIQCKVFLTLSENTKSSQSRNGVKFIDQEISVCELFRV